MQALQAGESNHRQGHRRSGAGGTGKTIPFPLLFFPHPPPLSRRLRATGEGRYDKKMHFRAPFYRVSGLVINSFNLLKRKSPGV